jgi:hypothetical protein
VGPGSQVARVTGARDDDLELEERGSGTGRHGMANEYRPAADPQVSGRGFWPVARRGWVSGGNVGFIFISIF